MSLLPAQVPGYANFSIKDIQMAMDVLSLQKSAKTPEEAMQKPYQFWSTQPVPKMGNISLAVKIVCILENLFFCLFV